MIKITDAAAEQIRAANNNPDVFEMILRVAAYHSDQFPRRGNVFTPGNRRVQEISAFGFERIRHL